MSVRITADRASLIDERGSIAEELAAEDAAHSAKTAVRRARGAALDAEIVSWYEHEAPESEHAPAGERYVAKVGPRGNRSSIISLSKVYKRLGRATFMAHAEIGLGVLRALLTGEVGDFIKTERTGNRTVSVVRKAS